MTEHKCECRSCQIRRAMVKHEPDPIVGNVMDKFSRRSAAGIAHYGMTMQDNPKSRMGWIEDVQEELMDAILYLERLKADI